MKTLNSPVASCNISFLTHAKDTSPQPIGVLEVINRTSNGFYAAQIKAIRELYQLTLQSAGGNHKAAKKAVVSLKNQLPAIQWSGVFSARGDKNIVRYSGLLCADLDHLDEDAIAKTLGALALDPYCYAAFISPTGTGIKAVFRVSPEAGNHRRNFDAVVAHVLKTHGLSMDTLDVQCKNMERLCYVSHGDVHFNENAVALPLLPPNLTRLCAAPPLVSPAGRQDSATKLLGPIEWVSETEGFGRCPGEPLHSGANGPQDFKVMLDGAPTVTCFHQSCSGIVAGVNHQLRSEIGKTESCTTGERTTVVVYYAYKQSCYWKQDARGVWITLPEASVRRHLRQAGFRAKASPGQPLSEIDARFNDIQTTSTVDYSGALAGYNTGVYDICGKRVLVTSSPTRIAPVEGEWRTVRAFLENLTQDPNHRQFDHLLGWLKMATESFASGAKRPGQALVLAGPVGSGKSLLQGLITELLGGRSAKPYRYMSGATQFNAELLCAEHQMIEDDVSSTDIRSRRHFGSHVKQIAVNATQSCHAKGEDALSLTPFWRVSISVNEEPENLMILPVLDDSIADKIMLLKTNRCDMPMPVGTQEQKDAFWAALTSELPAFLHFLTTHEVPSDLKDDRYGVLHFHHPDLLAAMDDLAPEIRLLSLMDQCLWQEEIGESGKLKVKKNNPLTYTAEGLEALLVCSPFGHEAKKLLGWNGATGTYLGRLAKKFPTRVQNDRTKASRAWLIFPPTP